MSSGFEIEKNNTLLNLPSLYEMVLLISAGHLR